MSDPYQRLEIIMAAKGLKAAGFAREIGCHPSTITKVKRHGRGIGLELATAIKKRWGYSVEWLCDGSGEMLDYEVAPKKHAPRTDTKLTPALDLRGIEMNEENKPDQGTAVRMLLDIFESGDSKAVDAIYKNLEYFSTAARRGQSDRRRVIDPDWPAEKERRKGAAGQKPQQGQ